MTTEVWRDLGPVPGACTVCATDGRLALLEVRSRRSLVELLRGEHVAGPARLVACGGCGWRWAAPDDRPAVRAVRGALDVAAPSRDWAETPLPEPSSPHGRAEGHAGRTALPSPRSRPALSARLG